MEVSITKGLLAALCIGLTAFLFSEKVGKKIESTNKKNGIISGISRVYAETTVRLLFSAIGVVGIFIAFGPEWGIPCALCMIPIYIVEMIGCIWSRLRIVRRDKIDAEKPSMKSESK